jgi:toxin YoeB
MNISFSQRGWSEYLNWQKTDKKNLVKIHRLLKDILRDPFDGVGKPEPLKHELSGFWARRINSEHRLVYEVTEDQINIVSCRFYYD